MHPEAATQCTEQEAEARQGDLRQVVLQHSLHLLLLLLSRLLLHLPRVQQQQQMLPLTLSRLLLHLSRVQQLQQQLLPQQQQLQQLLLLQQEWPLGVQAHGAQWGIPRGQGGEGALAMLDVVKIQGCEAAGKVSRIHVLALGKLNPKINAPGPALLQGCCVIHLHHWVF